MNKFKVLSALIVVAFSLFACSTINDLSVNNQNSENEISIENTEDETILTISSISWLNGFQDKINKFEQLHPGVKIVWNSYSEQMLQYEPQVGTAIMSGVSDDLIQISNEISYAYGNSSYFTDLNKIIEEDNSFNMDNYYENILESCEMNGNLYFFPSSFYFSGYIGVNNKFKDYTTPLLSSMDQINYGELLDLYESIEDKEGYYIYYNYDYLNMGFVNQFIDFESKTCDFVNNEFIDQLNSIKSYRYPDKPYNGGTGVDRGDEGFDTFIFTEMTQSSKQYLLPNEEPFNQLEFGPGTLKFSDFTLIVNESGEMEITPLLCFAIPENSKNKEIAWEFIKFLSSPDSLVENWMMFTEPASINKEANEQLVRYFYYNHFLTENNLTAEFLTPEVESVIEETIESYLSVFDLPAFTNSINPFIDCFDILDKFIKDEITDIQTAENIENRVKLMLME